MKRIYRKTQVALGVLCFTMSACSKNKQIQKDPIIKQPVFDTPLVRAPEKDMNNSKLELKRDLETVFDYAVLKSKLQAHYSTLEPKEWKNHPVGVKTKLTIADNEKVIALTLDACGGPKGSGFDQGLIEFLQREQIPATLFISGKWIDANRHEFERLSQNPLFEIGNHGLNHKPASVNGKSAYRISGTKSIEELVDEIELGARKIHMITGKRPHFYRSGTAFYDEIAISIAKDLGQTVVGFSLNVDAGAVLSKEQVNSNLISAKSGDIAILHFNQPQSGNRLGVISALPELKTKGFRFVKLSQMELE